MRFKINSHQKINKIINKRNPNKLRRSKWLKREEEEGGKRNNKKNQNNKYNKYSKTKKKTNKTIINPIMKLMIKGIKQARIIQKVKMYLSLDSEEVQGERLNKRKSRRRWKNKTDKKLQRIWDNKILKRLKIKYKRLNMKMMDKMMMSNNNKNQEKRKNQDRREKPLGRE